MRKAHHRGRRKTKHQGLIAATVANISRLDVLGALGQTTHKPGPTVMANPIKVASNIVLSLAMCACL
jgi:hypothetical protein